LHPPAGLEVRALSMSRLTAAGVTKDGRMVFWNDTRDGMDMPTSASRRSATAAGPDCNEDAPRGN
jgi:hypothetical protein